MKLRSLFSGIVFIILLASGISAQNQRYYWYRSIVDDNGAVGLYTSLELDKNDRPYIAYSMNNGYVGGIKLAHFNGSNWIIHTIDRVGGHTSLALDTDGVAHISYSTFLNELRYVKYQNNEWEVTILDSLGQIGFDTSIAVGKSGQVHIAYWIEYSLNESPVELNLLYAFYDGNQWSVHTPIDSVVPNGKWSDIVLDANERPHVSYVRQSYGQMKYGYLSDNGKWLVEALPKPISDPLEGYCNSIAIDSKGKIHLSYLQYISGNSYILKYAYGDFSNWNIFPLDTIFADEFSSYTSIQVTSDDLPIIAYHDSTGGGQLKLAYQYNGKWNFEIVDSAGAVGQYCSLDLTTDNLPVVSYYDAMHSVLKLAEARLMPPTDTDQDGLPDYIEIARGTDPGDKDSDDDGLSDGEEDQNKNGLVEEYETDPRNPDTDRDGLSDGLEMGRSLGIPPVGSIKGTDKTRFTGDIDPNTRTNPLKIDTDSDGISDGDEDINKNGKVDLDESDPADPDSDNDGLNDGLELRRNTSPIDLDSDDDGLRDDVEDLNRNGSLDPGETDPSLADTDFDGLPDGLEQGITKPVVSPDTSGWIRATDLAKFLSDMDPSTKTDPTNPDTDSDGLKDGQEDRNRNGRFDTEETNPLNRDTDGDGVADGVEVKAGIDPLDIDADDDGISDGWEDKNKNGKLDSGETAPWKYDTDNDGVPDGIEAGITEGLPDPDGNGPIKATDPARFRPDSDPSVNSDPTIWDTDNDGLSDGEEDRNRNGRIDPGETNFVMPDTDNDGLMDGDEVFFGSDPLDPKKKAKLNIVFSEKFQEGNLKNWIIVDQGDLEGPSEWLVNENTLFQISNIGSDVSDSLSSILKPGTIIYYSGLKFQDFRLTVSLLSMDDDELGVLFRMKSVDEYYRFSMNRELGYARLIRVSNGIPVLLAEEPFRYKINYLYQLKIYGIANKIKIYLDNVPLIRVLDNYSIADGNIGFYTWKNAGAGFKDITVAGTDVPVSALSFVDFFKAVSKDSIIEVQWTIRPYSALHSFSLYRIEPNQTVLLTTRTLGANKTPGNPLAGTYFDYWTTGKQAYQIQILSKKGRVLQTEQTSWLKKNMPQDFNVSKAYPNPSSLGTWFSLQLPSSSKITIRIYDRLGRLIRKFPATILNKGVHRVYWDGTNDNGIKVASGLYFVEIEAKDNSGGAKRYWRQTRKVMIMLN